jgi:copper chaperone CopZ
MTAELTVSGMSCANCVRHVTEADSTTVPALVAAIEDAGYAATPAAAR